MRSKRRTFWAVTLVIVVLIIAACAPRVGGGDTMAIPGAENLALDLPALVIDFDSDGRPSVADVPLAQLGDAVAPGALDGLTLPPDVVQFMVDSNIQHLQISNSPEGLVLLVNGRAVPSLKWDGGELDNTSQVVRLLGADLGAGMVLVEDLLPLVTHMGVGVIATFPVAEGIAEIPFTSEETDGARLAVQRRQESFLEAVDSQPTISVPIIYDAQGSWRVGDLTYAEWISLTGMPIFDSIRLRPEAVDSLIEQGITEFAVSTDVDGIHVSINGNSLPYVGWADGELSNALVLAEQMGLWETLEGQNINVDDVVAMVETVLPVVQATEITITAHFPESLASAN